jgi:hypothetical protein
VAQSEIQIEKIEAYLATDYRVGSGSEAFVLRIGQRSSDLARHYDETALQGALFITAFNPLGLRQDDDANAAAHELLETRLRNMSSVVIEGSGSDPDGDWPPEGSFLVLGIGAEEARRLGRQFQQDAVVWAGDDATPELLLLR